jgi:EmrB/QacA subfamily drug resistance transporter
MSAAIEARRPQAEWLIPLVVASGLLIELMDSAALALALPTIAQDFGVDAVHLRLVLTAYVITVAILVCSSAWLASRFGAKRVFATAIAVFIAGSICCGLSSSMLQLACARVLQGCGGAMMTPVGRSIVVATMPRAGLVKAMGWFTTPAIIGPMLGPPLAGILIETASWRWIFFINVPIGIAGIIAVLHLVPHVESRVSAAFDRKGFALLGLAIAALILPVEIGQVLPRLAQYALAATGIACFALYVAHAMRTERPVLDLRLLRHASLRVSLIAGSLTRISVGALPFLLPLLLQVAIGVSPLATSNVTMAMALGTLSARFTLPPLLRAFGFKHSMLLLAALTAGCALIPISFQAGTPLAVMAAAMCVASAVRAAFLVSTTTLTYADVEQDEIGQATVLMAVCQQLSLAAGISLAGWLLELRAGTNALTAAHFYPAFIVLAGIIAASIPVLARMPSNVATELRGRA